MRFVVIQTAWLGDNILTTPLVENLACAGEVDVVTTPAWSQVYEGNPHVHEVITFDKRGQERGALGLLRKARALKKRGYDAALLPQMWWRSAILAYLARIPERIGFKSAPARALYTHTVPYRAKRHELVRLLELLTPLGIEARVVPPRLYPQDRHEERAAEILRSAGLDSAPLAAIAPGSQWETKRYPFFDEVAKGLSAEGFRVIVLGSRSEEELCRLVASAVPGASAIVGEEILTVAAILRRCDILVCGDTGAGHIASAVGTPVVSIFGPTTPEQGFAPFGERNAVVQLELDCRPCGKHGGKRCPLGHHKCMRGIRPEVVVEAARRVVSKTPCLRAAK